MRSCFRLTEVVFKSFWVKKYSVFLPKEENIVTNQYERKLHTRTPQSHNYNFHTFTASLNLPSAQHQITGYQDMLHHSFIHSISIAPFQVHYYSEVLPKQHGYCVRVSHRSATGNCEWRIVQGSYVAARAGFEPTTLQMKGDESSNEPPRLKCIRLQEFSRYTAGSCRQAKNWGWQRSKHSQLYLYWNK